MDRLRYYQKTITPTTTAGQHVRNLRRQAGLSQLDLALMAGVSQRHLSCVETGRARASPGTLHAVLSALGASLEYCNEVFLAAGYAPRYAATPLESPALDVVHAAIEQILQANNPVPAIVLDNNWDITAANVSTGLLLAMAGIPQDSAAGLNLLETLLSPGGLGDRLANAQEVRAAAWHRAARESACNPALAKRLSSLPPPGNAMPATVTSPMLLTRVCTANGELSFVSTFTTFGMPLDITVESLRIEHLLPADLSTRQRMAQAFEQWNLAHGYR